MSNLHRFFVPSEAIVGSAVRFSPEQAHQIGRVLRLAAGDRVIALDDTGHEYEVALEQVGRGVVVGAISAQRPATGEPGTAVFLYLSLLRGERFDWAVQKATELGVRGVVPILPQRTVAHPKDLVARMERWRRIAQEAAEQCCRGRIPEIGIPRPLADALDFAGAAFMPWEAERSVALGEAVGGLATGEPVALYIGPEGGFEAAEVERAREAGVMPVSLGPRILRAETAVVVALTILWERLGELEPGSAQGMQ